MTNLQSIIDGIGAVVSGENIAGAVRTEAQNDSTVGDKVLAAISGYNSVIAIAGFAVGAPEVVAAAAIAGVVIGTACIGNDIYHLATDYNNIETNSNAGGDPAVLSAAITDYQNSRKNLALDSVGTLLGGLGVQGGVVSLGQEVSVFLEQQGPQLGLQASSFLNSTIQLYVQNSAINDQQNGTSSTEQIATPFPSPSEGFGTVIGVVDINNSQGPILSGLTGISIDDPSSGTQFSDMADEQGNYEVTVALANTTINYSDMTISAFDPISSADQGFPFILSTASLNLTGLTSTPSFAVPPLVGACTDTDAGNPDSDDPDCD